MSADICLSSLSFWGLDDRNFQATVGVWNSVLVDDIDLYNTLANPDKHDENDPDNMLKLTSSQYYDLKKMNIALKSFGDESLLLFHFNTRSLSKNLDILNEFQYSLDRKPDILCISESKLNEETVDNIDIIGYKMFHRDSVTSAGGTVIYVSKSIKAVERLTLNLK